jgi:ppGpp synthetase/RelA/SpoT-type nucleotidyltranferase
MLSGNAIKKLGKKLRDGTAGIEELNLLDVYRAEFEPLLLETCENIVSLLNGEIKFLVAGRMKRTKSIIRKLARDSNAGMDLSRMGDLVGLRIIVSDILEQDRAIELLSAGLSLVNSPRDYRDRITGYRAVHLIVGNSSHRVEIQIRTLAQHLWADESERLGEQVKEGTMSAEVADYLAELNVLSRNSEYENQVEFSNSRKAQSWRAQLKRKDSTFQFVTSKYCEAVNKSYVVVYHQTTNTLLRVESFSPVQRAEAISFFNSSSREHDGAGYDILVLNSPSREALAITHPRYFPEG